MDRGRLSYLEEALRNINRMIGSLRANPRVDLRVLEGLEKQRLTLEEEIAKIKSTASNKALSIFGLLDGFDDEETIRLPDKPVRPQSNTGS